MIGILGGLAWTALQKAAVGGAMHATNVLVNRLLSDSPTPNRTIIVQKIKMPYQISIDEDRKTEFLRKVRQLQIKTGKKYKVQIQQSNHQIIRVPKQLRQDKNKHDQFLREISNFQKKTNKKAKIIYY